MSRNKNKNIPLKIVLECVKKNKKTESIPTEVLLEQKNST